MPARVAARTSRFAVPPGTSYVRVTLFPRDDLVADDSAMAVASPPRKVRVLLVTNGRCVLAEGAVIAPRRRR